mmetsp:Transcript_8931/g.8822  ORF Transcript_8931/g.8822 Transcript_8931/m.8822 type:complete len:368 (-) Transcript_8931:356-1459(-)
MVLRKGCVIILTGMLMILTLEIHSFKLQSTCARKLITSPNRYHIANTREAKKHENEMIKRNRAVPLLSSINFAGNDLPKIGKDVGNKLSTGSMEQDGYFYSFEIYACQRETQKLVSSHLANWLRAEIYCLRECGTFSMLLNSVCGRRVVWVMGWKAQGNVVARSIGVMSAFDGMRKRGEGPDGGPTALKESSHMYYPSHSMPQEKGSPSLLTFDLANTEKYPLFSIDVYNCFEPQRHEELAKNLEKALNSLFPGMDTDISGNPDQSNPDIRVSQINPDMQIPDLKAMHLLRSTDKQSCVVLGSWSNLNTNSYKQINEMLSYKDEIAEAKKISIEGTYSDIVDKTSPSRIYYVSDVLLPDSLEENFFM